MRRIDGEVVALDMTCPAGAPVAIERLVQEEPAALRDELRKVRRSRGRGRGIEPKRRSLVIRRNAPVGAGVDRTACWGPSGRMSPAGFWPDRTTNARSGKKPVKAARSQGHGERVCSRCRCVRSYPYQEVQGFGESGVTGAWPVVDQPEVERGVCRQQSHGRGHGARHQIDR